MGSWTPAEPSGPPGRQPPGPPARWRALLRRVLGVLPPEERGALLASLDELYRLRLERHGAAAARRWYRGEVVSCALRLPAETIRRRAARTARGREGTMRSLAKDVGLAVRRLARVPAFTAAALLTLGVGIGGATLIFSVVDHVVLRPLPYREPDRLVAIWPEGSMTRGDASVIDDASRTVERVALWSRTDGFNLESDGTAVRVTATRVSPALHPLLGVRPVHGRLFAPGETEVGRDRVVLLAHGFWRERYGADAAVVGRTLRLDGEDYQVAGVLPPSATFPDPETQLYLPVQEAGVHPGEYWGSGGYAAIGRLAPGATPAEATAELSGPVAEEIRARNPVWTPHPSFRDDSRVVGLHEALVGDVRGMLLVLLGAVGLLLAVVCANVANLLLGRGLARSRETAVRVALGAGRGALVRDPLLESVLLAAGGCIVGSGAALLGLAALERWLTAELPRAAEIALDGRILAVAVGLSLLTGVLAGFVPALRSASVPPARALAGGARGGGGTPSRRRLSSALVTGQVAAAAVLVIGAGLLARSLVARASVAPGFQPEGIVTARVTLAGGDYASPEARLDFFRRLEERLEADAAVTAVSVAGSIPFGRHQQGFAVFIDGVTDDPNVLPAFDHFNVSADALETLELPVLEGRGLEPSDVEGAVRVGLVDATAAGELWPDGSPVGARVRRPWATAPWITIVGVVGAVRDDDVTAAPTRTIYTPFAQEPSLAATVLVRLAASVDRGAEEGMSATVGASMRRIVEELDPTVTVSRVAPYPALLADSYATARLLTALLTGFAAVALFLGCLGVYGVAAYAVRDRTREIGIRMTLGAEGRTIRSSVLRDGLRLALPGALIGVAVAVPASGLLEALLFEVEALDPVTFVGVPFVLAAAAVLATFVPALRATRVDPARVLRSE